MGMWSEETWGSFQGMHKLFEAYTHLIARTLFEQPVLLNDRVILLSGKWYSYYTATIW